MHWIIVVMWAGGATFGIDLSGKNSDRTYYATLAECQEHGPAFAEQQGKFQGGAPVEWFCQKENDQEAPPRPAVRHRSDLDEK
jgi:hypothetical protein